MCTRGRKDEMGKMRDTCVLGMILLVVTTATVDAQQDQRPLSPAGHSATQIGGDAYDGRQGYIDGKWIEITYGRPIIRGRDLFGPDDFVEFLNDGAPVWRAGANVTTRLSSEVPLKVGNTVIPPGEYTVFIELTPRDWTLIISTLQAQTQGFTKDDPDSVSGAYGYTPDRDLVRVPMQLETLRYSHDQLHWEFLDITPTGGKLAIFWANRMASVPFTRAE
jgi:hypothetical protein